jgi:toxin ParE1/3/4
VSYRLEIREDALADIEAAAVWYEEQQSGLGADFTRRVRHAIDALAANPLIHRLRDRRRNVRWCLPPRFPYRIVYRVRDDLVTVFAVIQAARHDGHWKKRV